MTELKPCPFCGGKVSLVLCDDEGNLHDEAYRERPYSGLGFMLHHAHDAVPVVRCKDCKHLCVWNRKDIYAFCPKTNIVFLPFDKDTRAFFCSLGERKEGGDG